jgi:hypothetical protein
MDSTRLRVLLGLFLLGSLDWALFCMLSTVVNRILPALLLVADKLLRTHTTSNPLFSKELIEPAIFADPLHALYPTCQHNREMVV